MDINLPGMNGVECVRRLKPLRLKSGRDAHLYEDTEKSSMRWRQAHRLPAETHRASELLDSIRECVGGPDTTHIARKSCNLQRREPLQPTENCPSGTGSARLPQSGFLYKESRETRNQLRNSAHLHPPHYENPVQQDGSRREFLRR